LTHCGDGVRNCDESDLDCGGSCQPCDNTTNPNINNTNIPRIIGRVTQFAGQHWLSAVILLLFPVVAYLFYRLGVFFSGKKKKK
jgi:hypothetical protein